MFFAKTKTKRLANTYKKQLDFCLTINDCMGRQIDGVWLGDDGVVGGIGLHMTACVNIHSFLCPALDGDLYLNKGDGVYKMSYDNSSSERILTNRCKCSLNYGNHVYLNDGTHTYTEDGNVVNDLDFVAMAGCGERVFGLGADNKIYFSQVGGAWDETNYFVPNITVTTLATLNNQLYLFGSGVYKFVVSAQTQDCKLVPICNKLGSILAKSVTVVGDKIVFACLDSLYKVSNNKVTWCCDISQFDASLCTYGNYRGYYAVCYSKNTTKYLMFVDTNTWLVKGVIKSGIEGLMEIDDTLYLCYTYLYELVNTTDNAKISFECDFGNAENKVLEKISFNASKGGKITVVGADGTRQYSFSASNRTQYLPVYSVGNSFSVIISSNDVLNIKNVTLYARPTKGVN